MASFVEGAEVLNAKLKSFDENFTAYMDDHLEAQIRDLRQMTADLVPVDTGQGREAVLSDDAIQRRPRRGKSGLASWTFGLANTREQARRTFYLFWREFGTKGYAAGERRRSGVTKTGRIRFSKVKTMIPARPATPFFRPAVSEFMVRLRQTRAIAKIYAAAVTAAGLNGSSRD